VKEAVPLNVLDSKYTLGAEMLTFPFQMQFGSKSSMEVPVKFKLCVVVPSCVNFAISSLPAEKPSPPIAIVFVAAKVAVPEAPCPKRIPFPEVELRIIFPLN
jgi:hypothetical protein